MSIVLFTRSLILMDQCCIHWQSTCICGRQCSWVCRWWGLAFSIIWEVDLSQGWSQNRYNWCCCTQGYYSCRHSCNLHTRNKQRRDYYYSQCNIQETFVQVFAWSQPKKGTIFLAQKSQEAGMETKVSLSGSILFHFANVFVASEAPGIFLWTLIHIYCVVL